MKSKGEKIGYIPRVMSSFPDETETTILNTLENTLDNCWKQLTLKVAAHEKEYGDKRPDANQQPLVMSGLTTTGGWRGGGRMFSRTSLAIGNENEPRGEN